LHSGSPGFRAAVEGLHAAGFHVPPTGYPQVYFFDPDRHLLEWNAAVLDC